LKVKKGLSGYKLLCKLEFFDLAEIHLRKTFLKIIKRSNLPENLKENIRYLKTVLFNSYNRRYYESNVFPDNRLTVDDKLIYFRSNYDPTLLLVFYYNL
jgi:hypothetical protein